MKTEDLKVMTPYRLRECHETFKKGFNLFLLIESGGAIGQNPFGGHIRRGETFFVVRAPERFEYFHGQDNDHYSGEVIWLMSATREAIGYYHIYDDHKARSLFQFVEEVTNSNEDH